MLSSVFAVFCLTFYCNDYTIMYGDYTLSLVEGGGHNGILHPWVYMHLSTDDTTKTSESLLTGSPMHIASVIRLTYYDVYPIT